MKKNNLSRYKTEFDEISDDQITRIEEYLSKHKLNKKDIKKFNEYIKKNNNEEYNYLKIVMYILPEPTPRPRMNRFSSNFYVRNSNSNNKFVKLMVNDFNDMIGFISTPCEFTVKNYFPIPKTFSKVETLLAELGMISMVSSPDWDNLGKTYSDMIQKHILCNDSLIIRGTSEKYYSLKPRVEIIIKYKQDYDTPKMKRLVEQSISYKDGVDERNEKI